MADTDNPHIRITRGEGGEVEAEGAIDQPASSLLQRAGFITRPMLWGTWYRLPFDLGEQWENEHATYAAAMLLAARYDVTLSPSLEVTGAAAERHPTSPSAPALGRTTLRTGTPSMPPVARAEHSLPPNDSTPPPGRQRRSRR